MLPCTAEFLCRLRLMLLAVSASSSEQLNRGQAVIADRSAALAPSTVLAHPHLTEDSCLLRHGVSFPRQTQNTGFFQVPPGATGRTLDGGAFARRSLGLAGRIPPFLWHEAGRAGRLKSQPRAGLVLIAGCNMPSPNDCMERVR